MKNSYTKAKAIGIVLLVVMLVQNGFSEEHNEPKESQEDIDRIFHSLSLGSHISVVRDHFGVGLEMITPYFLNKTVALSLYAAGHIVDSTIISMKETNNEAETFTEDYIWYQMFGLFRMSLVSATKGNRFRGYGKIGPTLYVVRDKTWDDYYNTLFRLPLAHDTGPDVMWGIHGLGGIELFFLKKDNHGPGLNSSIFIETGYEILFFDHVSPELAQLSALDNYDAFEYNFTISMGARVYFGK